MDGVELGFSIIVRIEFLPIEIELLGNYDIEKQACRFHLEFSKCRKNGSRCTDVFNH